MYKDAKKDAEYWYDKAKILKSSYLVLEAQLMTCQQESNPDHYNSPTALEALQQIKDLCEKKEGSYYPLLGLDILDIVETVGDLTYEEGYWESS
jgi:hypothetical protein